MERKEGERNKRRGKERETEIETGRQLDKERESLLPNENESVWRVEEGDWLGDQEARKSKIKCILTLQLFLYIFTNLSWSLMGSTLGGLALLGTSSQPAVSSFHLESADSE